MSEYIVDGKPRLEMDGWNAKFVLDYREEIVRCRDCKHYRFKDFSHIFKDDRHNDSFCVRFVDGKRMEVNPDGFCAWAERD